MYGEYPANLPPAIAEVRIRVIGKKANTEGRQCITQAIPEVDVAKETNVGYLADRYAQTETPTSTLADPTSSNSIT